MLLTPEARLANEMILNALRSLKFSGFDPGTQRVIMECVGKVLILNSTQDMSIDERIEMVETTLYTDTRELFKKLTEEPRDKS